MTAVRSTRIKASTKAKTLQDIFPCDASAATGDFVRASATIAGGVDVASNNAIKRPVIGLILSKPTTTTAEILLLGKASGFSGLTQGDTVFLSSTGTATTTAPGGSGYLQILGAATNTTEIIFSPQLRVVRRNP